MPSGTWQLCFSFTVSNLIVSSFAGFSRTAWHNMDYLQWRRMNSGAYQTNSLHTCFPAQHQSPQGWERVQNSRRKCYSLQFLDYNSCKARHISYSTVTSDTNLFSPFAHLLSEKHWDSIFKAVQRRASAGVKWHNCAQQLLLVFEGNGAVVIYICRSLICHCISLAFSLAACFSFPFAWQNRWCNSQLSYSVFHHYSSKHCAAKGEQNYPHVIFRGKYLKLMKWTDQHMGLGSTRASGVLNQDQPPPFSRCQEDLEVLHQTFAHLHTKTQQPEAV